MNSGAASSPQNRGVGLFAKDALRPAESKFSTLDSINTPPARRSLDWRYQKVVEAEKALRQRHIPAGANTVPMTEALENDLRDLGSRALSLADEILDASMYGQWSPCNM
jgi:hypothetical protein